MRLDFVAVVTQWTGRDRLLDRFNPSPGQSPPTCPPTHPHARPSTHLPARPHARRPPGTDRPRPRSLWPPQGRKISSRKPEPIEPSPSSSTPSSPFSNTFVYFLCFADRRGAGGSTREIAWKKKSTTCRPVFAHGSLPPAVIITIYCHWRQTTRTPARLVRFKLTRRLTLQPIRPNSSTCTPARVLPFSSAGLAVCLARPRALMGLGIRFVDDPAPHTPRTRRHASITRRTRAHLPRAQPHRAYPP